MTNASPTPSPTSLPNTPPKTPPQTPRLIVGPFNRVEGDLELQIDTETDAANRLVVSSARVNSPLYRGFENMLTGRNPMDALTIVPRICGICSVSQSVAAARAIGAAMGAKPPPNGERATHLMQACENLADHLTHFYLFFMPDFTRPCYASRSWYADAKRRFAAITQADGGGDHSRAATAARVRWFEIMGVLGGKWPHTGSILPTGSSRAIEPVEQIRLGVRLREMRHFLERTLYGAKLETIAALDSEQALQNLCAQHPSSDLALFARIAHDTHLQTLGQGPGLYLSYGAYGQAQGLWDEAAATVRPVDTAHISEDTASSWLQDAPNFAPLHPSQGQTLPQANKADAYSWNKAPRLAGQVVETGAIARQLVEGQTLIRSLSLHSGGNVYSRVIARLVELARILPRMEMSLAQLEHHAPYNTPAAMPSEGTGVGLTEAARGALGHWLRVEQGRISNYQIVAPTSWNFSPRDRQGTAGALEAALVGAPLDEGAPKQSVSIQHIVRSFDPCMVCTVH